MDSMKESLLLNAICLVFALASLAGAGYVIVTGQIFSTGVDGLFITMMCLLLALVFAINPILSLRSGALGDLLKSRRPRSSEQPAKPAEEAKKVAAQ